MELHGLRAEFQPQAHIDRQAQEKVAEDKNIQEAITRNNHDAPGADQASTAALTGVGSSIDTTA